MIEIFNSQVINGGFDQYFVNGYGQFSSLTITALVKIHAAKKAELLSESLRIVNVQKYDEETFKHKLITKDIDELFEDDEIARKLSRLNENYDEMEDEELEVLLTSYLSSQFNRK